MRLKVITAALLCALTISAYAVIQQDIVERDTIGGGGGGGGDLSSTDIDTFSELDAIVTDEDLVNLNDAQTLINKTLDFNSNTGKMLRHATDCTSYTGAVDGQYCWEQDEDVLYVCETADVCDTAGEWDAVASGGSPLTVEEADANPTISDVNKMQFDQADGFSVVNETGGQVQVDLTLTDSQVPNNITVDLATAASALAANPADCAVNQFANTIAANGNLTCSAVADADIPNNITIDLAAAATNLTANPADCTTPGQFATAIGANGNLTCSKPDGTLVTFRPQEYAPPASNFARIDSRNTTPILNFSTSTSECAVWMKVMPRNYAGNGVTMTIYSVAPTLTTGTVEWDVYFEKVDTAQDLDSDGFASSQSTSATSVSGTSGISVAQTVSFTDGAQMDSVTAGDPFRLKICRNVAGDNLAEDASFFIGELKEP